MIWETGSKSQLEIGKLFTGLHYAALAQGIRRAPYSPPEMLSARGLRCLIDEARALHRVSLLRW
jgi:hypothetical protein